MKLPDSAIKSTLTTFLKGTGDMPGEPRLLWTADACLGRFIPRVDCHRCAAACPAGALRMGRDGPELTGSCIGCGRCAADCPTGAMQVAGFENPGRFPIRNGSVRVDCWRAPQSHRATLRVPCLGGIDVGRIIEWTRLSGARIEFIDRGWCDNCDAHATKAVTSALAIASRLLRDLGMPPALRPRRAAEPLPVGRRAQDFPLPATEVQLGRRAFFRQLAAGTVSAAVATQAQSTDGRRACSAPKPVRFLKSVATLAAEHDTAIPAWPFPALHVSDRCRFHGACTANCPTGALARFDADTVSGLAFRADRCVACGACTDACPEHALTLAPRSGAATGLDRPQRVVEFPRRPCADCRQHFAAAGTDIWCADCRRRRTLARNLFDAIARKAASAAYESP